jgi:hypothetical protein
MSNIVIQRLSFARRRLADLKELGDAGLMSKSDDRQQLLQEFLFHLVGSVEFLAQEVNRSRGLDIPVEDVLPWKVGKELKGDKPIRDLLRELHPETKNKPLPADPYSPKGMHFRIILMRNFICHVGMERFLFRIGTSPPVSLYLDYRDPNRGHSNRHALRELEEFHRLVDTKGKRVIELLAEPGL